MPSAVPCGLRAYRHLSFAELYPQTPRISNGLTVNPWRRRQQLAGSGGSNGQVAAAPRCAQRGGAMRPRCAASNSTSTSSMDEVPSSSGGGGGGGAASSTSTSVVEPPAAVSGGGDEGGSSLPRPSRRVSELMQAMDVDLSIRESKALEVTESMVEVVSEQRGGGVKGGAHAAAATSASAGSSSGMAAGESEEVPDVASGPTPPPAAPPATATTAATRLADVEATSVAPAASWFVNSSGMSADVVTLGYALLLGFVVATSVFTFDVAIQYIHDLPDIFAKQLHIGGGRATGLVVFDNSIPFRCIMPIGAGFAVAALQQRGLAPPLKALTRAIEAVVDEKSKASFPSDYGQVFRKAAASAITLGSGASLGPEAPSVELGANTAAVLMPKWINKRRQRMLIAAGAAAGVSAAFDAPVTGALFAVEFVLKSSRLGLDRLSTATVFVSTSVAAAVVGYERKEGLSYGISGAATHLQGRIPYFSVSPNLLVDVLQFGALGLGCAAAAVLLYYGIRSSEGLLKRLPKGLAPPVAGALCGLLALQYPTVQYGYINLQEVLNDSSATPPADILSLLVAKIAATSVCVGGGLVGGLFAPSLFIGALVGDTMGHYFADEWGLADPTTLVVVGAAAVLGAVCRAPLTAIALMFEITRDSGLLIPMLSAIGIASLVSELVENALDKKVDKAVADVYLRLNSLGWWNTAAGFALGGAAGATVGGLTKPEAEKSKTVQSVMSTNIKLYVRHTLPLEQARDAIVARRSRAAVVVDDSFTPLGLVYLEDIEAELIKQEMLSEPDSNFGR